MGMLNREDREKMLNQKSLVIWFTGLPCSGKTTISTELQSVLFQKDLLTYVLDGDKVREGLNSDLGFSLEDRTENIRRIGEVTKLFADAGLIIIVAFISPFRKDRDLVRNALQPDQFVEVYVDCPVKECERRDTKGHYKRARNGEITNFTGISSPYEPPLKPEVHLKTHIEDFTQSTNRIIDYLIQTNRIPQKIPLPLRVE